MAEGVSSIGVGASDLRVILDWSLVFPSTLTVLSIGGVFESLSWIFF